MSWFLNNRAQAVRDARYELNARFDDRRERFAGSAPDPKTESAFSAEDDREAWEAMTQEERDHISALLEHNRRRAQERRENDPIPF